MYIVTFTIQMTNSYFLFLDRDIKAVFFKDPAINQKISDNIGDGGA